MKTLFIFLSLLTKITSQQPTGATTSFTCPSTCENEVNSNCYFPNSDCTSFYQCLSGVLAGELYCPDGLLFNEGLSVCDFSANTNCDATNTPTESPTLTLAPLPFTFDYLTTYSNPVNEFCSYATDDCTGFYL